MGFIIFCIIVLIWMIWLIVSAIKQSSDESPSSPPLDISYDTLNPPASFSPEMRDRLQEIAEYYGVRYVTGEETRKWILHRLDEDFSAMPGWDIWDTSIHEVPGQFERAERATMDEQMSILCYDPRYQLAKIQGRTAIYLTSYKRCRCPDYRKRRLPCKHMYALAMELDGNIGKCILNTTNAPLYGLTLALVGHLPRNRNGKDGIRAKITERGGIWTDNIEPDISAVVIGTNPSSARLSSIERLDIETLSPESVKDIFDPEGIFGTVYSQEKLSSPTSEPDVVLTPGIVQQDEAVQRRQSDNMPYDLIEQETQHIEKYRALTLESQGALDLLMDQLLTTQTGLERAEEGHKDTKAKEK